MSSEEILAIPPPPADSRLSYGPSAEQFIDVRMPESKGPHPLALFIHGGYWRARYDLTHAGHLCHALKKVGIATWNVEYRRVGNHGGGWPRSFQDIRSAYQLLRNHRGIDLDRICIAGHSAGGQLALCLAAYEHSVSRVFSLAGVLDLHQAWALHLSNDAVAEFLGGSPSEIPDRYREASPTELSIPVKTKQKLVHGTEDDDVPFEIAANYAERKKQSGENVELVTLDRIGHYEIVDPGSQVWSKVQAIFLDLLRS